MSALQQVQAYERCKLMIVIAIISRKCSEVNDTSIPMSYISASRPSVSLLTTADQCCNEKFLFKGTPFLALPPICLKVGLKAPFNLTRRSGECCNLSCPRGVWDGTPARNVFQSIFAFRKPHLVTLFRIIFFIFRRPKMFPRLPFDYGQ